MDTVTCYPDKAPRVDRLMDTLGNSDRREVIHYFENFLSGTTATVDELVSHIVERVPGKDSQKLSIELLHSHLPKLQSRGWLEFDRRNKTIQYYGHETADQLLEDLIEVFAD